MSTSFFRIEMRRKRDVIIARQCARHIAHMLGYEPADVTAIAATVFALARNCLAQAGRVTLHFHVRRNVLQVVPEVPEAASIPLEASSLWSGWRLEKPLPQHEAALSIEDLAWSLQTMSEFVSNNLFEEVEQQNDDLLNTLRELRACQNELARLKAHMHGAAA